MATAHFGQMVIGPPGGGKSTYCSGMYDLLTSLGRDVRIINLDPACSPQLPYPCAIDVRSLITLDDVMECYGLGPNGGVIYAMEYLATNLDWLRRSIAQLPSAAYLLFDFPGQVELYTCSTALDTLYTFLHSMSPHLTAVHLIDSYHLHSPSTFLSAVLLSLSSMCRLSLPHVNVISKMDSCERLGELPLPLSAYTDGLELAYIMQHIRAEMQHDGRPTIKGRRERGERGEKQHRTASKSELLTSSDAAGPHGSDGAEDADSEEYVEFESGEMSEDDEHKAGSGPPATENIEPRYLRLSEVLCEMVDSYSLVSFATLAIHDKRSVLTLLRTIDSSNGYIFTNTDREYEMAASRQQFQQQQQRRQQSDARSRPTHTTTSTTSIFNLVNTQYQRSTPPPSAATETRQSLRSNAALHHFTDCAVLLSLRFAQTHHSRAQRTSNSPVIAVAPQAKQQ